MFFSGDHSTRKRVDLGGRSSKERDRKVLLEQTRLERKRRLELKQQTNAAITIQKCFRGRKVAKHARSQIRIQFCQAFGDGCENVNKHCFNSDSDFLRQFLFFFTASNKKDIHLLVKICQLVLQFSELNGGVVSLFADKDYISKHSILEIRVKKLVYFCLEAVHHNRDNLKNQMLMPHEHNSLTAIILFQTVVQLANPDLPWACKVVDHLLHNKVYLMLRGIILTGLVLLPSIHDHTSQITNKPEPCAISSSIEHVLILISSHTGQNLCTCSNIDLQWSFSFQLLSIPYFWRHFPQVKEVFASRKLIMHYVHQIASCLPIDVNILPSVSPEFPGYACLIGNLLDAAGITLSGPDCSFLMAMDFVTVSTFLLEYMPKLPSAGEMSIKSEDDMDEDPKETLDMGLLRQISNSIDSRLLQNLVNALFKHTLLISGSDVRVQSSEEVEAIYAICAFLHVTFNTLRVERIMTGLAYRTDLVPALWNYIKKCHVNQRWPTCKLAVYVPGDSFGWLLPLTVFCPVYKHMLMIIDNEEFYEQEKPLSIRDIKLLVIILKQALWDLLWTIPGAGSVPLSQKPILKDTDHKKLTVDFIKDKARIGVSGLLSQLQDWNNRRLFTNPSDFHAPEATNEMFISQALFDNSRASEILKQAPFLVPFTSRVKIFNSQLAASRQDEAHVAFARNRFKIRRDQIFEDAFNHLSKLSEESLRGSIRVSFINEFGAEEAGIDGGGIFKDFMENITRAAFDVQYGLFKETVDHLLYPNPGSGLIHDQHLQYFHFLGTILGKAMYEGVLVDIPFATFFLSKLKEKHNYLNDLPSLDPELYRHLLFLKHYKGDISELEIYFVTVSNEYGENVEEELRPGGKSMRVTNDNVIQFIHLIANHRLNYQIRHQSTHFLRGFQQLIKKEWIEMFSEHEIQLLISGSLDSLNVDDLRLHAQYSGGYHADHPVIEMFWEVLKSFSLDQQMKFLKFVTGCSRGPLLGFSYLDPKFCIQRTASLHLVDADLDRLPTSATCMNLLKLPPYQSKEQMQAKLLYAINADAGFDLS